MLRYLKPSYFSLFQNYNLFEIGISWRYIELPNMQNLLIKGQIKKKAGLFRLDMDPTSP